MRNILVFVVLFCMVSVSAHADFEIGDVLRAVATAAASNYVGQRLDRGNQPQQVQRSSVPLGRVLVEADNCPDFVGACLKTLFTEAGFQAIAASSRDSWEAEQQRTAGPAYNRYAAAKPGTLKGAEYIAHVSVITGTGPCRQIDICSRNFQLNVNREQEWAILTLSLSGSDGIDVASVNAPGVHSATSVEMSRGWFRRAGFDIQQCADSDFAVIDACHRAVNAVTRQMMARSQSASTSPARIVGFTGGKWVINRGAMQDVRLGQRFYVLGEQIMGPDGGVSYVRKAEIQVVELDSNGNAAFCSVTRLAQPIAVGNLIKEVWQ